MTGPNKGNASITEVRSFWDEHPLFGYESDAEPGTQAFFDRHNRARNDDVERFALHLYKFDRHAGERVLDIGCGIGWLCEHFARGGANAVGVDLSGQAVSLTRQRLQVYGLAGEALLGSAESLPVQDGSVDFVTAAGSLHHTPDTEACVAEVYRALRPGGRAMVSVYYRNWLLSPLLWPVTRLAVRYLFGSLPGRSAFRRVRTPDEFVRAYDGNENPLGKAYTRGTLLGMCRMFSVERVEVHYFPRRFLPFHRLMPRWLHAILDRFAGTMLYVTLRKPVA